MGGETKAEGAYLTIGELADELGLPHHILRYWETRFPQLKPLQRAGNRRYYRPEDAALAREINRLLYKEGYTVKGVQRVITTKPLPEGVAPKHAEPKSADAAAKVADDIAIPIRSARPVDTLIAELHGVRARMVRALEGLDALD